MTGMLPVRECGFPAKHADVRSREGNARIAGGLVGNMAYQTTDDDGNVHNCGEPSKEEKAAGDKDAAEWDPEGNIPLSRLE